MSTKTDARSKQQAKIDNFFQKANKRKNDEETGPDSTIPKVPKTPSDSQCDTTAQSDVQPPLPKGSEVAASLSSAPAAQTSTPPVSSQAIAAQIDEMFSAEHVHQNDKCLLSSCCNISKTEKERLKEKNLKFQHGWLNMKVALCEKTGIWWPIFVEGQGFYCFLCRKHDVFNPQNKNKVFNKEASTRIRAEAFTDHASPQQHKNAITAEMLQRVSCFQKEVDHREKVLDSVLSKVFTILYWVVKEEIANKKAVSLIGLAKKIGLEDLKYFKHESSASLREMILSLGTAIEDTLLHKLRQASHFGLLIDEVTDISVFEQMVTFVQFFYKPNNEVQIALLSVDNLLEESDSANAQTITDTIVKTLSDFDLDPARLSSIVTDSAMVMTGKQNGVAAKLRRDVNSKIINIHCICHRLALACTDTLDDASFFKQVQLWLVQLWKLFENSAKKLAVYLKVQTEMKGLNMCSQSEKRASRWLKKACQTRWLSFNNSVQSLKREYPVVLQTLNKLQDTDSAAVGLLVKLRSFKFVSAIYILAEVLPHLDCLSKTFRVGTVALSNIVPSIEYTKDKLDEIVDTMTPVTMLCSDLENDSRLKMLDVSPSEKDRTDMKNLCRKYVNALKQNIDARFQDSLPIVRAFSVLDTTFPNKNDPVFKTYGEGQMVIIAEYFEIDSDELLAKWGKFKYDILKWKEDLEVVSQTDVLKKLANLSVFYPFLSSVADVILSLPVSNAWPERGASAVKRIKTRTRSSLKNDMLQLLLHVSVNGPEVQSSELDCLVKRAVGIWMQKSRRKLPKGYVDAPRLAATSSSDASVQTDVLTAADVIPRQELLQLIREEVSAYEKAVDLGLHDTCISSSSDSDSELY